ncbi:MAG TPA: rhodanese-like domain-containing protein, partial [Accumulibacter sp.]|nr:rhodanese-like domain-containing protein [Accumulibacter sp.]
MEFIQQNIFLIVLAAISGTSLLTMSVRRPGGRSLTASQATMLINRENAVLIDVREANEYAGGHLSAARNIPAGALAERAGRLCREMEKLFAARGIAICVNRAFSMFTLFFQGGPVYDLSSALRSDTDFY